MDLTPNTRLPETRFGSLRAHPNCNVECLLSGRCDRPLLADAGLLGTAAFDPYRTFIAKGGGNRAS
jgi:hypothetical protein